MEDKGGLLRTRISAKLINNQMGNGGFRVYKRSSIFRQLSFKKSQIVDVSDRPLYRGQLGLYAKTGQLLMGYYESRGFLSLRFESIFILCGPWSSVNFDEFDKNNSKNHC